MHQCFFHYSLATSMTNWVQIFTGLLFYAYVGIHQVRILAFDNYQMCPVPLKTNHHRVVYFESTASPRGLTANRTFLEIQTHLVQIQYSFKKYSHANITKTFMLVPGKIRSGSYGQPACIAMAHLCSCNSVVFYSFVAADVTMFFPVTTLSHY